MDFELPEELAADRGHPYNLEVSIAKYAAAEAAAFCADAALKILGAYGYSTEFPAERYYRDAKSYQIVEGIGEHSEAHYRARCAGLPEGEPLNGDG
jgi:alkylation response protein AidB-like acyl-CoA dehydrogenase